jgi:hypothetical protein
MTNAYDDSFAPEDNSPVSGENSSSDWRVDGRLGRVTDVVGRAAEAEVVGHGLDHVVAIVLVSVVYHTPDEIQYLVAGVTVHWGSCPQLDAVNPDGEVGACASAVRVRRFRRRTCSHRPVTWAAPAHSGLLCGNPARYASGGDCRPPARIPPGCRPGSAWRSFFQGRRPASLQRGRCGRSAHALRPRLEVRSVWRENWPPAAQNRRTPRLTARRAATTFSSRFRRVQVLARPGGRGLARAGPRRRVRISRARN